MEQEEARAAVERYGPMVYRLALAQTHSAHDADDVFQEVFLRYVRGAPILRRRSTGRRGCCG